MATNDEIVDRLRDALISVAPIEPRPADIARIRALAAARADRTSSGGSFSPTAEIVRAVLPLRSRRTAQVLAIAASLAAGFAIGSQVESVVIGNARAGITEFDQSIADASGGSVTVEGCLAGIGRIIDLSSSDLPILPKGRFYEVWFVGPGDTPQSQNRISAGTFHPDQAGKTRVVLTAAVDPRLYPTIVITAEPGDGNPAPSSTEVLRGQLKIIN
ncbi:MAG: anti-sigma factor [Microbacteriaceae bacterium]|nr:anti-sigma factor [Microbacteriaceae bacterium]